MLVHDDTLMLKARKVIYELLPGFESMLLHHEMVIRQDTFDRCLSLLDRCEAMASPKLQSAIKKVKSNLLREDMREQLGITITR